MNYENTYIIPDMQKSIIELVSTLEDLVEEANTNYLFGEDINEAKVLEKAEKIVSKYKKIISNYK